MERGNIWDFGGPWLACSDVLAIQQQQHNHRFTAIIQVDLCYELVDFVGAKFYCPHALADGNQCIQIREKTLEFSSTVGCQCYLQCYLYCLGTSHVSVSLMYLLYSTLFTLRQRMLVGGHTPDMPDFSQLLEVADDQLFNNPHHTLYQLLPPQSAASQNYNLRRCIHDRQLHEHEGHLSDCNFITRLLYKNSY